MSLLQYRGIVLIFVYVYSSLIRNSHQLKEGLPVGSRRSNNHSSGNVGSLLFPGLRLDNEAYFRICGKILKPEPAALPAVVPETGSEAEIALSCAAAL